MAADLPPPLSPPPAALDRRTLLRGAAALGAVSALGGLGLAACGGDGGGDTAAPADEGAGPGGLSLVALVNSAASLAAGTPARLPLGLGNDRGTLVGDSPVELPFTVHTVEGQEVEPGRTVRRHAAGLPHAYYPLTFTPPAPGHYTVATEVDGTALEASFTVSDPADIAIPQPGRPFPALVTPTVDTPGEVDPICTRDPACPLHGEELTTVLGTAPVALLVSTPAFCQQAICGPVLEILLGSPAHPVRFLHLEVYRSAAEVEEQGLRAPLAPAVDQLGLPFEPCLFLIAADGTLAQRLDVVYDRNELSAALDALRA